MKVFNVKRTRSYYYKKFYNTESHDVRIEYTLRKRLWITFFGIPFFYLKEIYVAPSMEELAEIR